MATKETELQLYFSTSSTSNQNTNMASGTIISAHDLKKMNQQQLLKYHTDAIKNLKQTIENLVEISCSNQSLISQATAIWANLTTAQKILAGLAVALTPATIGILANIPIFMAISGVNLSIYMGGGALLDNHAAHTHEKQEDIKQHLFRLADVVGGIIYSLCDLATSLNNEIEKLKQENSNFKNHVQTLRKEILEMSNQVSMSRENNNFLLREQNKLQQTIHNLEEQFAHNTQEYKDALDELDLKKQLQEEINKKLESELQQLKLKEDDLNKTIENNKLSMQFLNEAIKNMATTISQSSSEQGNFYAKIDSTLKNQEQQSSEILDKLKKTEQEMNAQKEELTSRVKEYQELIAEQKKIHALTLKVIQGKVSQQEIQQDSRSISEQLGKYGHFERVIQVDDDKNAITVIDAPPPASSSIN
ncbi:MAG: hypothetical protein BGO90_06825 [Legionella sp. 40-6]|nr:hypothetical protein [Legionella sp.]OJX93424.1 MAG: hypothetical protein BGO90_06825 [Legionella sp. 40-6]